MTPPELGLTLGRCRTGDAHDSSQFSIVFTFLELLCPLLPLFRTRPLPTLTPSRMGMRPDMSLEGVIVCQFRLKVTVIRKLLNKEEA